MQVGYVALLVELKSGSKVSLPFSVFNFAALELTIGLHASYTLQAKALLPLSGTYSQYAFFRFYTHALAAYLGLFH
jgi:hypothetical protein